MVGLAVVAVTVVVVILQEEMLVCAVGSECDGSNAETREESLEAVPPTEGTSITPGLTIQLLVSRCRKQAVVGNGEAIILASPGIPLGPDGIGRGSSLQLVDIKAGRVPNRHGGR